MDNQPQGTGIFMQVFSHLLQKAYQNLYYAAHHQVEQQVYRPLYNKITADSETQVNFLIDVEISRQVGHQLRKRSSNEPI